MLKKIHLVGIAFSVVLFTMIGFSAGITAATYGGVSVTEPIDALATGPTVFHVAELTTPFGFTPEAVGIPADTTIVLPGIPITVTVLGITVSVSGLSTATVFGGGGAIVGALVGLYYVVDIRMEQRREERADEDASDAPTD